MVKTKAALEFDYDGKLDLELFLQEPEYRKLEDQIVKIDFINEKESSFVYLDTKGNLIFEKCHDDEKERHVFN